MKKRTLVILLYIMFFMTMYGQKCERRCYKDVLNNIRFVPDSPHYKSQFYYLNNDCWEISDSCNVNIHVDGSGTTICAIGNGDGKFRAVYNFNFLYSIGKNAMLTGTVSNISKTDNVSVSFFQGNIVDECVLTEGDSIFKLTVPYTNQVCSSHCLAIYLDVNISNGKSVKLHDLNVSLDGIDVDDLNPLPKANEDHKFDITSYFNIEDNLTDKEISRLENICILWGFLKYYHPIIRIGDCNWNYQLFEMLSLYNEKRDNIFHHKLLQMIPDYADLPRRENQNTDPIIENVKLLWKDKLCDDIACVVNQIMKLDRNAPDVMNVGHAEEQKEALLTHFRNESAYDSFPVSDDGYRLLSLFRVWNMMYYFHPFMSRKEKHWIEILPEYIRLFAKSRDKKSYDYACARLMCELKDTHCMMFGTKYNGIDEHVWKSYYLPMDLHFYNGNFLITKLKTDEIKASGLKVGDIIIAVNDTLMPDICKERNKYSPLAKIDSDYFDGAYASVCSNNVCYTILRNGEKIKIEIPDIKKCWKGYTESVPYIMKAINDSTYYINLTVANQHDLLYAFECAKSFANIIFDMRGYPNNCDFMTLTQLISGYLYPKRKEVFIRSYADLASPGVFRKNPLNLSFGKENSNYYKGKVVVLVNSFTISAAEWVAEIIRNAPKGMSIGSSTSGTLGNTVSIPFINGVWSRFSNIEFYDMNGRNMYPQGVTIDYEIKPEQIELNRYDDYILEVAVKILDNEE